MSDDDFNKLCYAHGFGAVARDEFKIIPRTMLKALADAAAVEMYNRCYAAIVALRPQSGVNNDGQTMVQSVTRGECVQALKILGPNV